MPRSGRVCVLPQPRTRLSLTRHLQGNLHIEVNIEEECQSRDKPFLRQPPSLSLIKQRLGWSFLHRPNVRVILADGELYVHELPLSLLCEHFKQLFSSQFIEGSVEAPGESLGCAPEVAQRVADEEAEDKSVEPTAEYDSDYEEPQDRQSVPQIKHQRTLRIPFFRSVRSPKCHAHAK